MATYLDRIVEHHRERVRNDPRTLASLEAAAGESPRPRRFCDALSAARHVAPLAVIAEVKRRSPVRTEFRAEFEVSELSAAYVSGGAACISVLTDGPHFGGSFEDLAVVKQSVEVPVLRKDFTVSVRDVYETRAVGGDAVLLIAAVLDDTELRDCMALASELELAALVEVHDEVELERAMGNGAELLGVNQRDLHSFEVDPSRAARVVAAVPEGTTTVAESGIRGPVDAAALAEAGFVGVLVGEALVSSGNPEQAVRNLVQLDVEARPVPCS